PWWTASASPSGWPPPSPPRRSWPRCSPCGAPTWPPSPRAPPRPCRRPGGVRPPDGDGDRVIGSRRGGGEPGGRALLVDLYELTMADSQLAEGRGEAPATFSLFVRRLPPGWGFLLAGGLEPVLDHLEGLR